MMAAAGMFRTATATRGPLWAVSFVMSLALFAAASPARVAAFERSTVDGTDTPLYWRFRLVRVLTATDSSDDLSDLQVQDAVARSMLAWNSVSETCSDLWLVDAGRPVSRATSLTFGDPDMENRVVWRETDWPPEVSADTLAVTTVTYRRTSGQIIDADIDLNGVNHSWTDADSVELSQTDAQNTLTHELGHLLGLAHAPDADATMFASSEPGDLGKRSLAEDDAAALCFVYPAGLISPGAPLHTGQPLTSCAAGRPTPSPPWAMLGLFALGALRFHRRTVR